MPKCILDKYITLDEREKDNPHAVSQVTDYHAWCVDESNKVYDYPIEQIPSLAKTDKVIRRPFDIDHAIKFYPFMMDFRKCFFSYQTKVVPFTHEQKMAMINNNTFPVGHCLDRALTLRESDPRKFSVVIGSLGFIQPDGSIFWEYG